MLLTKGLWVWLDIDLSTWRLWPLYDVFQYEDESPVHRLGAGPLYLSWRFK